MARNLLISDKNFNFNPLVFCGVRGDFGVLCIVFASICCVVGGVVLLSVYLGVLSECGEGCKLSFSRFVFCVGVFLSLGGACGMNTVNLFCVGVTVVLCVGVLSTLAYVCLGVIVTVVHVRMQAFVSVVFCVCCREGVCVGVFCVCLVCLSRQ